MSGVEQMDTGKNIIIRNVLVEKYPLKVRLNLSMDYKMGWWYQEHIGKTFYVKETTQPELALLNFRASQNDAKRLLIVTRGDFKDCVILKEDCKVLSGQYE